MSSDDAKLDFLLIGGFGLGLYYFFKGFKTYREYRVLEDTPEMRIRGIPMGLVHVRGKATGEERLTSPVGRMPCYFYRVEIEKWKVENNSGSWSHHRTDTNGIRFYLEDGSGKALVDPTSAELELEHLCRREVSGDWNLSTQPLGAAAQVGAPAGTSRPTDTDLLSYVNQVTAGKIATFVEHRLEGAGTQHDIQKEQMRQAAIELLKHPMGGGDFVERMFTTLAPVAEKRLRDRGPESHPQNERARQEMLEALKHPIGSPEFNARVEQALATQGKPDEVTKFRSAMQSWRSRSAGGWGSAFPPASGRFRFTESCILPGLTYNVTGTCVENRSAKDEHDRNLITQGENEPTFLISSKAEKELEGSLRKRAALMIFGGAAGAIVCLGILLAKFGLF